MMQDEFNGKMQFADILIDPFKPEMDEEDGARRSAWYAQLVSDPEIKLALVKKGSSERTNVVVKLVGPQDLVVPAYHIIQ